ncbi:MAG: hypothetical protein CSA55_01555 [Ilumatobacter coccineus]|uniref:Uncharacterized protein n=1 Tax=Ilumatobacter coccineus TaxID=467094 RepID=A0A2G6KE81_9ACTN|nr:MAG: hypothetical protein CSA55_01555 [Ilumatobacter coccineus]
MVALSLEQAKIAGVVVTAALAIGALVIAWTVKQITQKVVGAAVFAVLAFLVWSQRSSLQDCANTIVADGVTNATCEFFGQDISIPLGD